MWISLNWLKKFVSIEQELSLEEWESIISLKIAEVENIKRIGQNLAKVNVVEILKVEDHPQADKLKVVTVTDGQEQKNIICSAFNCKEGMKTAFADLNNVLILGSGKQLLIQERKIRGISSYGMLCSKAELGLEDKGEGIIELPSQFQLGKKLSEFEEFNEQMDILFEIDNKSLTHRPDLWGHYGFARELSAIFEIPLQTYTNLKLSSNFFSSFSITNLIPDVCYRYSSLMIKGVRVQESPSWLKNYLFNLGINSVNNIVDLTNFVMLELGQPMHAFDADKLEGGITIRYALDKERFTDLQGESIVLSCKDIVIDNNGKAIALAGITGGGETSISSNTSNILLESACFSPQTIRKTVQLTGMKTESSNRFEKSLSPKNTVLAINRYVELLQKIDQQVSSYSQLEDINNNPYSIKSISLDYEFIYSKLGTRDISKDFINKKLELLGFELEKNEDKLDLKIPHWRSTGDISIKDDIVEEIARLYGYDNIKEQSLVMPLNIPTENKQRTLERKIKFSLVEGFGFNEIYSYPWTGEKQLKKYFLIPENLMQLTNPLSEDSKYMKLDPFPQIIDIVEKNLKYFSELKIFELGKIFNASKMISRILPKEEYYLAGAIANKNKGEKGFYKLKRVVEDIFKLSGLKHYQLTHWENAPKYVHPNINLKFCQKEKVVATIFKLSPIIKTKFSLKNDVFLFFVNFDYLLENERKFSYSAIHRFPTVNIDVTITLNERTWAIKPEMLIYQELGEYCHNVKLISIYQDEGLKKKREKNISFRITLIDKENTLSREKISQLQQKVMRLFDLVN